MESVLWAELDLRAGLREELGAGLRENSSGIGRGSGCLSADMQPASQFSLAAAYQEIKVRLASLERENSCIRRRLQHYEIKFPVISECVCVEDRGVCCVCDGKDKLISTEPSSSLQQRINALTQQLQESKAHEECLEQVIRAYEKIHLEKSNVQKELDHMTTLAEQHVQKIRGLESALRHRETLKNNQTINTRREMTHTHTHLHQRNTHLLHLHNSLDVPCALDSPGPTLHSSRSLDALTDLKVQRLEAELKGAWHEAQGAWQREAELKTKLQHLQEEIRLLQEKQSQGMDTPCGHCSVDWIKQAGDEQVDLALAYTELTEELGQVRKLISEQSEILRHKQNPPESKSPDLRHSSAPQRHLSSSSLSPPSAPSPFCPHSSSHCLRAHFQGRRSFSEASTPSSLQQGFLHSLHYPASTLPKKRQQRAVFTGQRPSSARSPAHNSLHCPVPAHNPTHSLTCIIPHLCTQDLPVPAPLVTPPQSSEDEEEEWPNTSSTHCPPRTLGAKPRRDPSTLQAYLSTEHAQSWPSIKLWMESEESDARSCPLCQLSFPTGFPEDALIKHIDSHLENSKI
ncbi:TANK-binding kinase 1-binding protein 1-like [Hoplias malabaricus]|uniref:TANK-binding kinase 1-binding protein 1-like n=1 Tax=Hoplias malabaricus TaxID=27720 RepID=UPI00346372C2